MIRKTLLSSVSVVVLSFANAHADTSQASTYVLQVASNLACETLNIDLISETTKSVSTLQYTTGAFAAIDLAPGNYKFGKLSCSTTEKEVEVFDELLEQLPNISLQNGKAYYGGKLILKDITQEAEAKNLQDCSVGISRARGMDNNECLTSGADQMRRNKRKVNVYAPVLAKEDVNAVRKALSASEDQLVYLPLLAQLN